MFWSENNGCHVSEEDICKLWVILYSIFTNAYNKITIREEGFNRCTSFTLHFLE